MNTWAGLATALCSLTTLSCGAVGVAPSATTFLVHAPLVPADAFATLKGQGDAHRELCANDGMHPHFPDDADRVTRAFCQDLKPGGRMPTPGSLAELQGLLGLDFKAPGGGNGTSANPAFALTGHSSSLVARFVSAINPRAIVFTPPPADGSKATDYAILAFTRGEQFAEVAVHDPTLDQLNFYLVFFAQACNAAPPGCTAGDLLTPRVEAGWQGVRVYESSTALNDTIGDCLECHQPDRNGPKMLRMQEDSDPFTHFFSRNTAGGRALLDDFHAAHGQDENYGPIPAALIDQSDPAKLAALLAAAGFAQQPNAFDSRSIEAEVSASAPLEPVVNDPPGRSATWQAAYDRAVTGGAIAVPYHDVKISDPARLARMTAAYQQLRSGQLEAPQLPDIRQVFLDAGLRDMGFAPKAGQGGRALLVNMCQQCHNPGLDPTISRARFDVTKLGELSRAEKDVAIARLLADDSSRLKMPPVLLRTVTDDERDQMVAELRR
jgi:hypothetical protein